MALTPGINQALAIIACDAIVDAVDAGGAGNLEIRDGTIPATCDDVQAGTIGADIPLSATAFGAAADNTPGAIATLLGVPLSDTSADNGITATHFSVSSGTPAVIFQGSVGTATTDIVMTSVVIVAAETVNLTALTFEVEENA